MIDDGVRYCMGCSLSSKQEPSIAFRSDHVSRCNDCESQQKKLQTHRECGRLAASNEYAACTRKAGHEGPCAHDFVGGLAPAVLMVPVSPSPMPSAAVDGTGGTMNAEGNRSNVGKLPWHLVPWDAVEEVVRVIDFGAKKYSPRGWEDKPLSWVETCASMTRHTVRFLMGEDRDKETGLHHMAHACCNGLFLVAYALRGVTVKDDRRNAA